MNTRLPNGNLIVPGGGHPRPGLNICPLCKMGMHPLTEHALICSGPEPHIFPSFPGLGMPPADQIMNMVRELGAALLIERDARAMAEALLATMVRAALRLKWAFGAPRRTIAQLRPLFKRLDLALDTVSAVFPILSFEEQETTEPTTGETMADATDVHPSETQTEESR